ncbi:amidase [Octadecabacter sp. G9-8]|uniref:Amidase n=1 Tax=Octadecabacter dasysiphoniae TaxID=2909341 RepID=A0ABS9CXL9_9RHOB|nr:amidase [Octadecabacter dasysiphoniae]MCF2871990.1 amidase [Octadecabacter dasysiphoniae]
MLKPPNPICDDIRALATGTQTAVSLAKRALDRAAGAAALNAFVTIDPGHVLAQAEASDARRKAGTPLSAIDGLAIAFKDNYLTVDYPTTACSDARPLEPGGMDATVVARLRAAGAVVFGKTNMHEWAYGATNTTSNIGKTNNPHNTDHITGGSSGGSAAAVAAGIVTVAMGSDTGGSIRIPASACGIYGFKPSYGRASRYGVLPLSWSLDATGPIATSLDAIAAILPIILGPDPNDVSTHTAVTFQTQEPPANVKIINLVGPGLERTGDVDACLRLALGRLSADVEDRELAGVRHYFAAWEAILHCEASSYHAELLARNPTGFSSVTRAHLEAGKELRAVEVLHAQKLRARLIKTLLSEFGNWDVLCLPTLPVTAPRHGDDWQEFGGRRVSTQDAMTWFCWIGNLAGLPCLTLPIGTGTSGLPVGMMLMGRPGEDEKLLAIGQQVDEQLGAGSGTDG